MKNLFKFMMAVAILLTASCAKEEISTSIAGGEVEVSFTANLADLGTRAYGDGTKANKLRYFVYDKANNQQPLSALCGEAPVNNGVATVHLVLIKGMTYELTFWADNSGLPYDFDGKVVTVDYNEVIANVEERDAFYAYIPEFNPANPEHKHKTNVTLTRPFAQLNAISTDDMAEVAKSGITLSTSYITLTAYNSFNLTTGEVSNPVEKTLDPGNILGNGLLSMNYLLAPADGYTTDVVITIENNKNINFGTSYSYVPLKRNYKTNITGKLLTGTADFNVTIDPIFGGEEDYEVEDVHVATAESLMAAVEAVAATGGEIVLTDDIELSSSLTITAPQATSRTAAEKVIVIDGKGRTLTYTGSGANARAIDVTSASNGANVVIKNLTINCTASYCQRGINYNTFGDLTLENVTVMGTNVTYALNLPGSSDNANVVINNSSLTGNIALNVWGENAVVTATDSHFTSVDNATSENYSAIVLNNDGTTIADGTVVNIYGGTVTALDENGELSNAVRNGTNSGVVNISESTVVTGKLAAPVAIVNYGTDQFYSCDTLQRAINKAAETNAVSVRLIKDVELKEPVTVAAGKSVVLDLNGKTISTVEESAGRHLYAIYNYGSLTIEGEGAINARGIKNFGSMVVNGNVTITNLDSNGGAAIWNEGNVVINAGNFISSPNAGVDSYGAALNTRAGGEAIVNGGNYYAYSQLTYAIVNEGTTTINNAVVKGKHGAVAGAESNDKTAIYGGSFSLLENPGVSDHCVYCVSAIYGGTFTLGNNTDCGAQVFYDSTIAEGYKSLEIATGVYKVVVSNYCGEEIVNQEGVLYVGDHFESGSMVNTLWFNNVPFGDDAAIKVIDKTYGAIIIENCVGEFKNDVITIDNENNSVMILENLNFTLAEGKKLIKSVNKIYQVFMSNITINGVKMTQESIAKYLENVEWYQVVEEI